MVNEHWKIGSNFFHFASDGKYTPCRKNTCFKNGNSATRSRVPALFFAFWRLCSLLCLHLGLGHPVNYFACSHADFISVTQGHLTVQQRCVANMLFSRMETHDHPCEVLIVHPVEKQSTWLRSRRIACYVQRSMTEKGLVPTVPVGVAYPK